MMIKKLKFGCPIILVLFFICLAVSGCNKTPSNLDSISSVLPSNEQGKTEDVTPPNQSDSQDATDTSTSQQQPIPEDEKKPDGIWSVASGGNGMPAPPIWMAIHTQTSKIKVGEELKATLLYEPLAGDYAEHYGKWLQHVNCTIIADRSNDGESIPDSEIIIKDTFNYTADLREEYSLSGSVFLMNVEELTIPAEWFSCDKGAITWQVIMEIFLNYDPEPIMYDKTAISLYYIKEGDSILLFGDHYSYSNYKRSP